MNYLSIEKIAKSYGIKELFKDISFGIDKGQKVALVAKNGTGKSTLLKVICGKETPDEGTVIVRNGIQIGFLDQVDKASTGTVKDYIFSGDKYQIIKKYDDLALNSPDSDEFYAALDEMTEINGWDIEQKAKKILSFLGHHDLEKSLTKMSGGEIKRLSLAKVLLDEPDLLILDEPTNHLDLDMIEWLEEYLTTANITLLMVTHDRYFLESICNTIIELDEGNCYRYKGNFSYYLEKRGERIDNEKQNISKAGSLMKKELEWIRRQPKARGTKSKSRVDAFDDIKTAATKKIDESKLELSVLSTRLGTKVIEFHKVSKSFGDLKILNKFTYNFGRGEKIGIVGKNGVGKTSFINLILAQIEPDAGKIVVGETVSFGYYQQKGLEFKDDQKVIDVIKDIAEHIPLEKGKTISAAQMLEKFFFPKGMHYQFVNSLSGGEKKRLYLITILMGTPNFLIMDEPTNDLDIYTIAALEDFLASFGGCLLVISHDRYFLDKICDHIFYFKGEGEIKDILGNYLSYRNYLNMEENSKVIVDVVKKIEVKTEKNVISNDERKEYMKLEGDIDKLEKKRKQIEAKMFEVVSNEEELIKLTKQLKDVNESVEEKTEKWMSLGELIEG
jgi:ATP-binding cassette subfamily F protein uup